MGAFAELQAVYARHRVATYPLRAGKTPAVRGYKRVGLDGSRRLVAKFPDADACGFFAGRHNGIAVIDIDSPDDRLVDEMQARFGATPLQVASPSGGRHLYYKHSGETRRIKPLPDVDILGSGNVVAAGSVVPKGRYQIERGSLDDLERLPPMRSASVQAPLRPIAYDGQRDNSLWRACMVEVRTCGTYEELENRALSLNEAMCRPPQPHAEVIHAAKSAWKRHSEGRNWVGRRPPVFIHAEEITQLVEHPDAGMLLLLLRREHLGLRDEFAIAPRSMAEAETGILRGWPDKRIRSARARLIDAGYLVEVHRGGAGPGDASVYAFPMWDATSHNTDKHPLPAPRGVSAAKGTSAAPRRDDKGPLEGKPTAVASAS
jgi:hypothetical protein